MWDEKTFKEILVPLQLPRLCVRHWRSSPKNSCHTALFCCCICTDLLLPVSHTRTHYVKCPNLKRGAQPKVLENLLLQAFYFIYHFQNVELNLYVTLLIPSYIVSHYRTKESILIFVGNEWKNAFRADSVYMTTKVA